MKKSIEKEIRALAKKHATEINKIVEKNNLGIQEFQFHYEDEFASEFKEDWDNR